MKVRSILGLLPHSAYTPSHPSPLSAGDDQDFNAARSYFKSRFCRLNRSTTKEIYPSFTNATDTSLLRIVMASVTDIILTNSLRDSECAVQAAVGPKSVTDVPPL